MLVAGFDIAREDVLPAFVPARNASYGIRTCRLPTAVLEIHPSPASGLREAHLDLRRRVPPGVAPAEDDSIWRLTFRHTTDLVLLAIGEPLVEPTARFRLQEDLVGAFPALGEVRALQRPPPSDPIGE